MMALALETDDAGLLQRLLAGGADPNEVVYSSASAYHRGMTALHAAAERDLRECCALLVAAGARVDATTNYGCTPLHLAARQGRTAFRGPRRRAAHAPDRQCGTTGLAWLF